jgi:hypothetical protein
MKEKTITLNLEEVNLLKMAMFEFEESTHLTIQYSPDRHDPKKKEELVKRANDIDNFKRRLYE